MTLESALRYTVLGGIFAIPFIVFIVAQSFFFPFITGKNFTFRVIVEIILGAYLALAVINPAYRPRRSLLLGAFALFVLIVALADVFGAYPFKSFWSNFERMDGWITLAHLFAYFLVVGATLDSERLWKRLFQVEVAVSAVVGLWALMQLFGIASLSEGFSSLTRLDASFGNPIYLAVYMLFNIGIAALLWVQMEKEAPRERSMLRYLYGGVIALDVIILFLTGTRGAMLGLLFGLGIGATLMLFSGESRRVRTWAVSILIGLVALAGTFFMIRDQAWVERVPVLNRVATISLTDGTTRARFYNWSMAWEGVKERPLLGWGQENYAVVFDRHYDPRMAGQEQWFDRVHNIIFDWLVAAGFLGLLSYLSLFAIALALLFRNSVFDAWERMVLAGMLAAYFFHNLFVFDNIMSYVLFTTVLAYVGSRAARSAPYLPLPSMGKYGFVVAGVALVFVWALAWFLNAGAIAANKTLLQALSPQQSLQTNLDYFKKALSYGSLGTQETREQLVQASAQMAGAEIPLEIKQAFFQVATEEMVKQGEESPMNARSPLFLGVLLNAYGDLENAAAALRRAHELSPRKQSILFELGANSFARNLPAEGVAYFKQAYEHNTEYVEARLYYAGAAIRVGDDALADDLLEPLIESGNAADPRIASAYVTRGRYDKIAPIWEKKVAASPSDLNAHYTLAAAYHATGQLQKAIAVLEKAGEISAEAKAEADALIQQLRSGSASLTP